MIIYNLWEEWEYQNPLKGTFIPNIVSYIHDENNEKRKALLVVPGGGYRMVAYAEGEIVAKKFYEKGYNTFVLSYTTAAFEPVVLALQPLKDLARAMAVLRKHAEELKIQSDQIAVCGFSAGGHLCGSLAVHFDDPKIQQEGEYKESNIRPDAVILSYPVITAGKYAHSDSFKVLLGEHASQEKLEYMSLEKQVKKNTPPVFLWHTATDEQVPVENSLLFTEACRKQNISCELHIFKEGSHGYSLANEEWASGCYGGDYTLNQWFSYMQYHIDHELNLPYPMNNINLPKGTDYRKVFLSDSKEYLKSTPNPSVALWPDLADAWLESVYKTLDRNR